MPQPADGPEAIPQRERGMKLLCLSNGHGEDAIAARVLTQLQAQAAAPAIAALPIVGEGEAYRRAGISRIGPIQPMPSGGFIYMDRRQLWRDLRGGLIGLALRQYRAVRRWAQGASARDPRAVLAVGDVVPLLLAWSSGLPYAFIGTAKSEYYLRDEAQWLPQTSRLERCVGSVYWPWERWLMRHRRCRGTFPRDALTAERLRQYGVPAFDLGNPMMDGLGAERAPAAQRRAALCVLLLPGSRAPEAYRNWQSLLQAAAAVETTLADWPVQFLAAIAPGLADGPLHDCLREQGWQAQSQPAVPAPIDDPEARSFARQRATLVLSRNAYSQCLHAADLALATAGTATEQFVGLGKPAIAIPGQGPQFTPAFAEAQSRLLGPSLQVADGAREAAERVRSLLQDPDRLHLIAQNGRRRMGEPGAAARIAGCLQQRLLAA